jgi:hypothetical protein
MQSESESFAPAAFSTPPVVSALVVTCRRSPSICTVNTLRRLKKTNTAPDAMRIIDIPNQEYFFIQNNSNSKTLEENKKTSFPKVERWDTPGMPR